MTDPVNGKAHHSGTIVCADPPDSAAVAIERADPLASAESIGSLDEMCECGHPHIRHDMIASRYCAATLAGSLPRGCVCPAESGAVSPQTS